MIKVDQIPYEVKRAMRAAWAMRSNDDRPEKHMADLAVALLNAWPGVQHNRVISDPYLILPLPQEVSDE